MFSISVLSSMILGNGRIFRASGIFWRRLGEVSRKVVDHFLVFVSYLSNLYSSSFSSISLVIFWNLRGHLQDLQLLLHLCLCLLLFRECFSWLFRNKIRLDCTLDCFWRFIWDLLAISCRNSSLFLPSRCLLWLRLVFMMWLHWSSFQDVFLLTA